MVKTVVALAVATAACGSVIAAPSRSSIARDLDRLEADLAHLAPGGGGAEHAAFLANEPSAEDNGSATAEAEAASAEAASAEASAEEAASAEAASAEGSGSSSAANPATADDGNDPLCAAIEGTCMDSNKNKCEGGTFVSSKCKRPGMSWSTRCCVPPAPDLRTDIQKQADANWEFLIANGNKGWDVDVPMTFDVPFARAVVTTAQNNEFGAKYVIPPKARNLWADMLTERVTAFQAEIGMTPPTGVIDEQLIAKLKERGPGGGPAMNSAEWGAALDKRFRENAANLAKVKDHERAPKGRELLTGLMAFHAGRFSTMPIRAKGISGRKIGYQYIENFYKSIFTGPNAKDCKRKGDGPGCNGSLATMSMSPTYERFFPVANRFFNQACMPKPSYMKNPKSSCRTGTDPKEMKSVSCPAGKTCVNQGAWSFCGIAVTATTKMATGNPDIRWALGAVGGVAAGYPGSTSEEQRVPKVNTKIGPGPDGPAPGDHMYLAVANSHQDMAWCLTDNYIFTIDSNGYYQETATNAKQRTSTRGNFYGFLRTLPLAEGEAAKYANMDCASEWSRLVARTARVNAILDELAGREMPWKESLHKWAFEYPFSQLF
eukprot:TRINITY_DN889_c0_g1_i1.p1 TRINITY_DN889_c0_g1~~TRINITY_DN889_c0_g1_i1.p1  ORF type:complete len:665 (+),score=269.65 TRINITY_DN889_c0_g1_i1:185-1996(+)